MVFEPFQAVLKYFGLFSATLVITLVITPSTMLPLNLLHFLVVSELFRRASEEVIRGYPEGARS